MAEIRTRDVVTANAFATKHAVSRFLHQRIHNSDDGPNPATLHVGANLRINREYSLYQPDYFDEGSWMRFVDLPEHPEWQRPALEWPLGTFKLKITTKPIGDTDLSERHVNYDSRPNAESGIIEEVLALKGLAVSIHGRVPKEQGLDRLIASGKLPESVETFYDWYVTSPGEKYPTQQALQSELELSELELVNIPGESDRRYPFSGSFVIARILPTTLTDL